MTKRASTDSIGLVTVAVAFAFGCQSETAVLDVPEMNGARSVVVAVSVPGSVRVFSQAVDSESVVISLPVGAPENGLVEIELLTYRSSLEELGLPSRELNSNPMGTRLPTPERVYRADIHDGETSEWTKTATPSEQLKAFRFGETVTLCREVSVEEYALPTSREVKFGIRVADHLALIGVEGDPLLVGPGGAQPLALSPAGARLAGGTVDDEGTPWFGGFRGQLYRGTFDGALSLELVSTSTTRQKFHTLSVVHVDGNLEAFAMGLKGERPSTIGHATR